MVLILPCFTGAPPKMDADGNVVSEQTGIMGHIMVAIRCSGAQGWTPGASRFLPCLLQGPTQIGFCWGSRRATQTRPAAMCNYSLFVMTSPTVGPDAAPRYLAFLALYGGVVTIVTSLFVSCYLPIRSTD